VRRHASERQPPAAGSASLATRLSRTMTEFMQYAGCWEPGCRKTG
jgi:hypothetical protein